MKEEMTSGIVTRRKTNDKSSNKQSETELINGKLRRGTINQDASNNSKSHIPAPLENKMIKDAVNKNRKACAAVGTDHTKTNQSASFNKPITSDVPKDSMLIKKPSIQVEQKAFLEKLKLNSNCVENNVPKPWYKSSMANDPLPSSNEQGCINSKR